MKSANIIAGIVIAFMLIVSCNSDSAKINSSTLYRGVLLLDSTGKELPFNFQLIRKDRVITIEIMNATEKILVEEVTETDDSLFFKMPVFDSEFRCKKYNDSLSGTWYNHSRTEKNKIEFRAYANQHYRFIEKQTNNIIAKQYKAVFSPGIKEDEFNALALFTIEKEYLQGTFLTETGDYRYLQGFANDTVVKLSCFDGSHAFLFEGKFIGKDSVSGMFYSGIHWKEPFGMRKNDTFQLRSPDSLTYMLNGAEEINFAYKNTEGKTVSLHDSKYNNKVVIVQLMGSWCPNCMDETKLLTAYYDKYNQSGLEIIALAFEKTKDFEKAASNVKRLKTKFNSGYDFLITEKTGKQEATESFAALNKITAFPTTLFIDKKKRVRKIYTGFNGPGTGSHYHKMEEETTRFIEMLLKEE